MQHKPDNLRSVREPWKESNHFIKLSHDLTSVSPQGSSTLRTLECGSTFLLPVRPCSLPGQPHCQNCCWPHAIPQLGTLDASCHSPRTEERVPERCPQMSSGGQRSSPDLHLWFRRMGLSSHRLSEASYCPPALQSPALCLWLCFLIVVFPRSRTFQDSGASPPPAQGGRSSTLALLIPGYTETHHVDKAGLKLTEIPCLGFLSTRI